MFCVVFPGTLTEVKVKYVKYVHHDLHNGLVLFCVFFSQMHEERAHSYYFSTFLYTTNL